MNAIADNGWIPTLTLCELKVWFVLYRLADNTNRVTVSHDRIAEMTGMRREHVARTTSRLERRGIVVVRRRGRKYGESGKRLANVYQLLAPAAASISAYGGTNGNEKQCRLSSPIRAAIGTPSELTEEADALGAHRKLQDVD